MTSAGPRRRSIRLRDYDYAEPGAYFVTICTQDRQCLFGETVGGEMAMSTYGRVVAAYWQAIPSHLPRVELDEWVVMPNHLHGILVIVDHADETHGMPRGRGEAFPESMTCRGEAFPQSGTIELATSEAESPIALQGDSRNASPLQRPTTPAGPTPGSLGAIVGNFKSVTTRRVNRMRHSPGARVWQRNYYEHIIRDEDTLRRVREYILNNPARWDEDRENPQLAANRTGGRW